MEPLPSQAEIDAQEEAKEHMALLEWQGYTVVRRLVLCDPVEHGWRWEFVPETPAEEVQE
jgi:hypothetical protein